MNKALLEIKKDNLLDVIDTIKSIANRENDLITKNTLFQCSTNLKSIYKLIENLDVEKKEPIKKMAICCK